MATVEKGWVSFKGDYACKAEGIVHLYALAVPPPPAPQDPKTRVMLSMGDSFTVPESFEDVLKAVLSAES